MHTVDSDRKPPRPKLPARERLIAVLPQVWELIRPRRGMLAVGFLLMVINRVSGLVLPYSTKYLIDSVIIKHNIQLLKPLVLGVLAATVVQGITSFSLTQLLSKAAQRLITELRQKVQAHVGWLPVSFHDSTKTGVLVARIMGDVEGVRNLIGTGLVDLVGGLMTAGIALVVLFRISALMTALAFGFLLAFALALRKAFGTIRPIFRERSKINAEVTGRLAGALGGGRGGKGYYAEDNEGESFFPRSAPSARKYAANSDRHFGYESFRQFAAGRGWSRNHVRGRAANHGRNVDHRRIFYLYAFPRLPGRAHYADRADRHSAHRSVGRVGTHPRNHEREPGRSRSQADCGSK